MSDGPVHSLQHLQATLAADRAKLAKLSIPNLKGALTKLGKLLTFSKKAVGNDEAVRQLISHVERLHQTTLTPILEAKGNNTFSISEGLKNSLSILFSNLDDAIPVESQPSIVGRLFPSHVDVASVVIDANSKIGGVLDTFLQQGTIQHSGDYNLVQTRPDPGGDLVSNPPPDGNHMHAQAGPSSQTPTTKLLSQVQNARDKCPRFRILLLGKSGAGKSSLINKVFGLSTAETADYKSGRANIEKEHTSELNDGFVLHDSEGFESGTFDQYKIVENFIQDRGSRTDLKERLHAIWLCTAIPVSGGRAFETGDEKIFELKIGNVPLIVIFTQFDNLVSKGRMEADYSDPNFGANAIAKTELEFEEICVRPLEKVCTEVGRNTPPFMRVSTQKSYEDTLSKLVRLTHEHLQADSKDQVPPRTNRQLGQGPSNSSSIPATDPPSAQESSAGIALAIAQRVDPITKIDAIIAIGRQRYWQGLASSFDFSGKTLKSCIDVLHEDITQVWNFLDPDKYLTDPAFKTLILQVVDDLVDKIKEDPIIIPNAKPSSAVGFSGMLSELAPPGVLTPLEITMAFVEWVSKVYQRTPEAVRCLMGYIIDLTVVMRLFWRLQVQEGVHSVTESMVQQAATKYHTSHDKAWVHGEIREFVGDMGIFARTRRDLVVGEVERLIRDPRLEPNSSTSQRR